ncbi:MAG: hypothetical protein IJU23_02595 [Proteobacteria bacterium]|nr:hypothetical protein [Pseudomonadota bacterium]
MYKKSLFALIVLGTLTFSANVNAQDNILALENSHQDSLYNADDDIVAAMKALDEVGAMIEPEKTADTNNTVDIDALLAAANAPEPAKTTTPVASKTEALKTVAKSETTKDETVIAKTETPNSTPKADVKTETVTEIKTVAKTETPKSETVVAKTETPDTAPKADVKTETLTETKTVAKEETTKSETVVAKTETPNTAPKADVKTETLTETKTVAKEETTKSETIVAKAETANTAPKAVVKTETVTETKTVAKTETTKNETVIAKTETANTAPKADLKTETLTETKTVVKAETPKNETVIAKAETTKTGNLAADGTPVTKSKQADIPAVNPGAAPHTLPMTYVMALYKLNGVDLSKVKAPMPTIAELYQHAFSQKLVYQSTHPSIGDLVFFHNTFDRNRDGRWNDWHSLVGIVESIDKDETISVLIYRQDKIERIHLNLKYPELQTGRKGQELNSQIRANEGAQIGTASKLFAGFANLLGDATSFTVVDNWKPGMKLPQ